MPYLNEAGLKTRTASLFDDAYLEALYWGRRQKISVAKLYFYRVLQLIRATEPDAIWLEKEALPWVPWIVERLFWPKNIPIISDYDDALFHRYDTHPTKIVRWLMQSKIDRVMAASKIVFAGNDYLADRARLAGASDIRHIPTVVDISAYQPMRHPAQDGRLRVGWIGTPKTWAEHGVPRMALLSKAMAEHNAMFRAIGADQPPKPVPGFEFLPWAEATEISQIQGIDIGVMPLTDSPMARGKCGYKLIQFMACGLPVIASPIGVNRQIVEHGVNGFLATTDAEWHMALTTLLSDTVLREKMGAAGRQKVIAEYSIQKYGPKVAQIFASL